MDRFSEKAIVSKVVPEYVSEAISEINKLISDFSFESDSDKANYLMALITPAVMEIIGHRAPMLAINNIELAHVIQVVHGVAPRVHVGDVISDTPPIVLIDKIVSEKLCRILSAGYYSCRVIGGDENYRKIKQMFIAAVDLSTITHDVGRRSIMCKSYKTKESDAIAYAAENSGKIQFYS